MPWRPRHCCSRRPLSSIERDSERCGGTLVGTRPPSGGTYTPLEVWWEGSPPPFTPSARAVPGELVAIPHGLPFPAGRLQVCARLLAGGSLRFPSVAAWEGGERGNRQRGPASKKGARGRPQHLCFGLPWKRHGRHTTSAEGNHDLSTQRRTGQLCPLSFPGPTPPQSRRGTMSWECPAHRRPSPSTCPDTTKSHPR